MKAKATLNRLVRVVLEEAERNPAFERALDEALGTGKKEATPADTPAQRKASQRPKNRRPPAVLDPVQLARAGVSALRAELQKLSLDALRDIVAEYGMDTGRLVMKWVDRERIIDRICEMSVARAHKGDAFRKPGAGSATTMNPEKDHAADRQQGGPPPEDRS